MRLVGWLEARLRPVFEVIIDRTRAAVLRVRGANVAAKVRVGAGCRITHPCCLSVGQRVQFEHDVFVKITCDSARLTVGDQVFVGCGTEFDVSERVVIGSNVLIVPGCFITDHTHLHRAGALIASQGCESTPVAIGDDVWLGAHSIILAGVTIGQGAIVAANSVVTGNVDAMTIVAGSPARFVGVRA